MDDDTLRVVVGCIVGVGLLVLGGRLRRGALGKRRLLRRPGDRGDDRD